MNGAGRERERTKRSSLILNSKTVYVLPWQLPWALWLFLVYCSATLIFFRINLTCSYPLRLGVSFLLNSPSSQRVMERGLRMEKRVRGFASESTGSHSSASHLHTSPQAPFSLQHHLLSLHLGFLIFRMGPIIFVPIE